MDYAFAYLEGTEADCSFAPPAPEPEPGPEVPPPVWDSRPILWQRCWDATKALCG
jgi:hypothetical protein